MAVSELANYLGSTGLWFPSVYEVAAIQKIVGLTSGMMLQDMQRPLYMQPKDAIEYGIIDGIVKPQTDIIDEVMNAEQWDKQAGLVAR